MDFDPTTSGRAGGVRSSYCRGRWTLYEACKQAQTWIDAGLPPLPVAVNISALEFQSKDFLESVRAILNKTRLNPRYLELELTESVLMQDAESTAPRSLHSKP